MRQTILFLILLLGTHLTYANSTPEFPFVIADGKASEDVKPDKAEIYMQVIAFSDSSESALKSVSTASSSIVQLTEKLKIPESKLEAHDLEKSTKRARDSEHNSLEILGYEVSRNIIINLDDLSSYSELMSGLVAIDNIARISTKFDIKERDSLQESLTAKASADARHKAKLMADSLGVAIHSVYAISQDSDFNYMLTKFGAKSDHYAAAYAPSTGGRPVMFVPETIGVSQRINVVFRLKD